MPIDIILDVPVIHPSDGGFVVHVPLRRGDPVLLIFAQRGLDAFKETFAEADPQKGAFFNERDAIAVPGFGALDITPASATGLSLQTEDGETSMVMERGHITFRARWVTFAADRIDDIAC